MPEGSDELELWRPPPEGEGMLGAGELRPELPELPDEPDEPDDPPEDGGEEDGEGIDVDED
jgi:hypothetical protein